MAYAILVESEVVIVSPRTRHFLKNISCRVSGALVSKVSKGSESVPPEVLEGLTSVERIALVLAVQLLVTERQVKRTKMIVRAAVLVAILATSIVADPRVIEVVGKSFYEVAQVFFAE